MGAATEALEAAYPNLMAISDPDALRQEAIAVLYPFRRDLGEAFGRFEHIIGTKDTIIQIQKYITDWILLGMGMSAGKTDRPKGHRAKSLHKAPEAWQWKEDRIRLAVADDVMEAIASEMAEDPDDRLYDQLSEDQKRAKKLAEDAGFDVKIIVEARGTSGTVRTNIPYEIDPEESEVAIGYSVWPEEKQTWDYPGAPAELEITDYKIEGGKPAPTGFEGWLYGSQVEDLIWDTLAGEEQGRDIEPYEQ